MRPSIGQHVRVLYDFETSKKGEITLLTGDIIQITEVVDDNWLRGRLNGAEGIFPSNFVESITLPSLQPGQKIFAGVDEFQAGQDGDLGINRGDIIVGLHQLDDNWWQGSCGGNTGIFPLTCVTELLDPPAKADQRSSQQKGSLSEPICARAMVDITPQIDGELGFGIGDVITITEIIDSDWYMGQFGGKEGLVSSVCVELLEDVIISESNAGHTTENHVQENQTSSALGNEISQANQLNVSSFSSENTRSYDTEITPYARTIYAFQGQSQDELSFAANEIVTLIQHVDSEWIEGELDGRIGLFPAGYVEIIVDCPYAETGQIQDLGQVQPDSPAQQYSAPTESSSAPATASSDLAESCSIGSTDSDQLGLVLHNFEGEVDGDLKVSEGDTVIVVQILDGNWIQARDETGHVGLVPLNHVQVIGEGPRHLPSDVDNVIQTSEPIVPIHKENGVSSNLDTSCEKTPEINNHKEDVEKLKKDGTDEESSTPRPATEKPRLKPKPAVKPKLAPKPVIKPKPIVLTPKPYTETLRNVHSLSVGHVSSPKEKNVFKGINTSKSLNSLIEEQLTSAKTESDELNRSRSSSTRSSESSPGSIKKQDSLTESNVQRSRPGSIISDKSSRPGSDAFEDLASLDQLVHEGNASVTSQYSEVSQQNSDQSVHFSDNSYQFNTDLPPPQSPKPKDANGFINSAFVKDHDDPHTLQMSLPARPPPPVPSVKGSKSKTRVPPLRAPPPRPSAPRPAQPAKATPLSAGSSKPHPIPLRPAPPVPKGPPKMPNRPAPVRPSIPNAPRRPPPRPPPSDLMSFSPEKDTSPDVDDEVNAEVVAELKGRIAEIQKDIQSYEKSCKELHQLCPAELRQYQAEQEAQRRREEAKRKMEEDKKRQEEQKQKRREKRENVIAELLATEKDYLRDLHLCIDAFLGPAAEKVPGVDMEVVFGNIEEIADVSQRLLTMLEGCINGKTFEEQIIGPNFVHFSEDMKNTYAPYCRNHDAVITLMEKYTDNVEVKEYFTRIITKLREQTNVFDLESLLIKPIQRILKYPLLLNELFKSTEDDHKDKQEIVKAISAMTDVATAINEYKRRKDLVFKYKKDSDQRFSEKIAKFNFHSIRKKSSRMRGRLSTNLGLGLQTRDENFEREEVRFRHIEKAIRVFQKNVSMYMEHMQECVGAEESLVADIVDLYDGQPSEEVKMYKEIQGKIVGPLLHTFRCTVEEQVLVPLSQLIQMFDGPNNVIEKRFDKMLDYDSQFRKAKDNEKNDALQIAKNDYEAMNAQLLDELPKLFSLAFKMLTDCMGAFTKAQKTFTDQTLKATYTLVQLPLLLSSDAGVIETFNISHSTALDRVSTLMFIPRGFNPKMDSMKPDKKQKRMSLGQGSAGRTVPAAGSSSPQSDSQRVYLRQLYPAAKLHRVGYTYSALDSMDLCLNEGIMVGVIKDQDPMGNKDKWFVDDGVKKGFVPKKILSPWSGEVGVGGAGSSPSGSLNSLMMEEGLESLGNDTMSDIISLSSTASQAQVYPSLTPEPVPEAQPEQYYYAEFAFQSRGASEVSMFEGQVITVIAKSDQEGNTEWWLVDADGKRGYAPANYLRPMS
ncbi:LOW QUALITY PROTEIN: dynamin-binding protein-like [Haliotis rubra]|uniref:LOW QUALITY PROTEIN: dynamin-binding protein-like n=1 Tax=Haliotis rubra TaxID=36100 RepID=UPI001EE635FA|nr:LOW QUALITY PROTEIN: dynamin-binding protein-like [Haliotis rubra]